MEHALIFVASLTGLWLGATWLTKGALGLAQRFGLSQGFIGMTLLALGTSFPEIMVSITAAQEQLAGTPTSGIVIGNVIGANMGLMALILGLVGVMGRVRVSREKMKIQGPSLILATVALLLFANDGLISRQEGVMLLAGYSVYLLFLNRTKTAGAKVREKKQRSSLLWLFLLLLGGAMVIGESAGHAIESAVAIAAQLGVSQLVIGAVLLGLGTTLPELTVTIAAVVKGASELSLGNLIGSNVVNILLVLGLGAVLSGWQLDRHVVQFDLPFLLLSMTVVVMFMITKGRLDRREALLMLALYAVYISLKFQGY